MSKVYELCYDPLMRIMWLGLHVAPSTSDVDDIVHEILEAYEGPFLLHAQHVGKESLFPGFDVVHHVLMHLYAHDDLIQQYLLGTLVHAQRLDPLFVAVKEFALRLFQPKKPVCITDRGAEAEAFKQRILAPYWRNAW